MYSIFFIKLGVTREPVRNRAHGENCRAFVKAPGTRRAPHQPAVGRPKQAGAGVSGEPAASRGVSPWARPRAEKGGGRWRSDHRLKKNEGYPKISGRCLILNKNNLHSKKGRGSGAVKTELKKLFFIKPRVENYHLLSIWFFKAKIG